MHPILTMRSMIFCIAMLLKFESAPCIYSRSGYSIVMSTVIKTTLQKIARDLSKHAPPAQNAYARAFIKVLIQLPLYLEDGVLFDDSETEAKYMDTMSDLGSLLTTYGTDSARVKDQVDALADWLSGIKFKTSRTSRSFKQIIRSYEGSYTMIEAHPLNMMHTLFCMIKKIIKPGPEHDTRVKNFDKYMQNLAIVGVSGVNAAYMCKKITPRIPTDKYYIASIGDPHFDIERFLIHGPYTAFFYCGDRNIFDAVCNVICESGMETVTSDSVASTGYYYVAHKLHGWRDMDNEEQDKHFKLMFPEPVDMIDIICIPF